MAGYLLTVPLSLGVMRLVQEAMFKEHRRQVHLAELLLSGLLEQRYHLAYAKGDDICYEFFAGVRERLQDTVLASDAVAVLEKVSNFVNARTGQPIEFRALLNNPMLASEIAWGEGTQRFAVVAAEVLRRLGGRYAELAQQFVVTARSTIDNQATTFALESYDEVATYLIYFDFDLAIEVLDMTADLHPEPVGELDEPLVEGLAEATVPNAPSYRARVLYSPAGQAMGYFTLPFNAHELENYILKMGRPRRGVRRLNSQEGQAAR